MHGLTLIRALTPHLDRYENRHARAVSNGAGIFMGIPRVYFPQWDTTVGGQRTVTLAPHPRDSGPIYRVTGPVDAISMLENWAVFE